MPRALALALCSCFGCRFGFEAQPIVATDAAAPDARIVTRTFGERPGAMTTEVTADATLDETAPMSNGGLAEDFAMSGVVERGLLRFDLSSIAPGTVVVAGRLELERIDFGDEFAGDIALRLAGQAWVEGTVSWNERDTGAAWTMAGGTVSGPNVPFGTPPAFAFTMPVPAAPLQSWIDVPATNFGFLLVAADEQSSVHYHVHSSESVLLTARPLLVLDLAQ